MLATYIPKKSVKVQLLADLAYEDFTIDKDTIEYATEGNGYALKSIGHEYYSCQLYHKAMAWYRLGAIENNSTAQNSIGIMYHNGKGAPQDYMFAMEWYLKAAIQNNKDAWGNIGILFKKGRGVAVDKHMALEWYYKSGKHPNRVQQLENQGIRLTEKNKKNPIEQLIIRTEDILLETRRKAEGKTALQQSKTEMEQKLIPKDNRIKHLEEKIETLQVISERKQNELETNQESIDQYKQKYHTKNNEIQALIQANNTVMAEIEAKRSLESVLQKQNKVLRARSQKSSQSPGKTIKDLEISNQTFEKLLVQEQKLRDTEIEIIKQKLEIERQKTNELQRRYRAIKDELKQIKIISQ